MYDLNFETEHELEYQLREWTEAYGLGFPQVPDDVFDHFKRVLKQLYPKNTLLAEIGARSKKNKEMLPFICGSLTNKFPPDIDAWLKRYETRHGYVLSHKLDGLALETEWVNGKLKNAWLRGDGFIGENVTEKAKVFLPPALTIANSIAAPFLTKVENIILTHEILLGVEPETLGYKNKRNAVGGIMHRDDGTHLEHLFCLAHNYKNPPEGELSSDELLRMQVLASLVPTVKFQFVENINMVVELATAMLEEETTYDKDGCVIAARKSHVENVKLPEEKIAFKINKQIAGTTAKVIEWNVSRTYKLIPLTYIDPVDLGGVTIGKCTAFNAKFVKDRGLSVGSELKVCRSGDVIPYIEEVVTSQAVELPHICPSCGSGVVWDDTEVHLYCTNKKCPPVIQKQIAHFFLLLGLEFFSEKMISSLGCNTIADVYNLEESDILNLEGWGDKSAKDFILRLQATKNTTPDKLLASLGISGLGQTMARTILEHHNLAALIKMATDENQADQVNIMCEIKGVAIKRATTILNGLRDNIDLLEQLGSLGLSIKDQEGGPFEGLGFEITGSLSRPRKEIVSWIEGAGGRQCSLSSATHLICNAESGSAKYKKAQKDGIPIITEEEAVALYFKLKKEKGL